MKKILTRFGEVEYDPAKVIRFAGGFIGFEDLRDFIVMPPIKGGPLFWVQSTERAEVAFILTDPTQFFVDYHVQPGTEERKRLEIGEEDECYVLSVVTVRGDKKATLNLLAPIFFAPKSNRALQVILEGSEYNTRHPLPQPAK